MLASSVTRAFPVRRSEPTEGTELQLRALSLCAQPIVARERDLAPLFGEVDRVPVILLEADHLTPGADIREEDRAQRGLELLDARFAVEVRRRRAERDDLRERLLKVGALRLQLADALGSEVCRWVAGLGRFGPTTEALLDILQLALELPAVVRRLLAEKAGLFDDGGSACSAPR